MREPEHPNRPAQMAHRPGDEAVAPPRPRVALRLLGAGAVRERQLHSVNRRARWLRSASAVHASGSLAAVTGRSAPRFRYGAAAEPDFRS